MAGEVTHDLEEATNNLRFSSVKLITFNSIVCGLEFCASAGFTYIPPLLLKAGIPEQWMGITLGIGPFLGFLTVPFLGQFSDRLSDKSLLGKRKPFILALCLLLLLTLLLIPYYGAYVQREGRADESDGEFNVTFSALLLCICVVLFDFASQVCLSPCEALLSDISSITEQNDQAFTAYSFMVSFGGCVGYFLSSIDWKSSYISLFFPEDSSQELISFSILTFLFLFTVILTLSSTRESAISAYKRLRRRRPPRDNGIGDSTESDASASDDATSPLIRVKSDENASLRLHACPSPDITRSRSDSPTLPVPLKFLPLILRPLNRLQRRLCRLIPATASITAACTALAHRLKPSPSSIPPILIPLMVAQFFSWSAMMALLIFYTDFVGRAVMGGDPNASVGSPEFVNYDLGVRVGSQGLFFNALVAMTFSLAMERLMRRFPSRILWTWSLYLFVSCSAAMLFTNSVPIHYFLIGLTGTFYACINALPIAVIGEYHQDQALYFGPNQNSSHMKSSHSVDGISEDEGKRGIGGDMALLDSAYFLSQVFITASLGYMSHWTGSVYSYIIFANISGILSILTLKHVVFNASEFLN